MVLTRHKNDPHSKTIVCYSLYGIIKKKNSGTICISGNANF